MTGRRLQRILVSIGFNVTFKLTFTQHALPVKLSCLWLVTIIVRVRAMESTSLQSVVTVTFVLSRH